MNAEDTAALRSIATDPASVVPSRAWPTRSSPGAMASQQVSKGNCVHDRAGCPALSRPTGRVFCKNQSACSPSATLHSRTGIPNFVHSHLDDVSASRTTLIERRFVATPLWPALTDVHRVFIRSCRSHRFQAPERRTGSHSVAPCFEVACKVAIDRLSSKTLASFRIDLFPRKNHTSPPTALRSRGIIPPANSTVR